MAGAGWFQIELHAGDATQVADDPMTVISYGLRMLWDGRSATSSIERSSGMTPSDRHWLIVVAIVSIAVGGMMSALLLMP
ncbi:hypothetical protein ASG43_20610 [Aureimonas sp. Leaf454]|nr:hypothetical protein ASG43_20610 [Aureimonas sp. Leaf454]